MALPTKQEYAECYSTMVEKLNADLKSLHITSLANRIASQHHKIIVDYHRDRSIPLRLYTETGQVCTAVRHRFVRNLIDKLDGALMPGSIEVLEAVGRQEDADRAELSALHLRALATRLWEHGPVYGLLQRIPAQVRLEIANGVESVGFSFPSVHQTGLSSAVASQPISSPDVLEAAKLVSGLWSGFLRHAGPWFASGGVSRMVVTHAEAQSNLRVTPECGISLLG